MFHVFVFHEMTGYGWYMCCTYRLDQRWYRDTVALCFPYGMQRAFCCFKWIQPLPGGLLQREKLYLLMFSRNLFVPDFVRRFFVSCTQISEAYAVRTLMKFGCDWRKIGHKGRCSKDFERTFINISDFFDSSYYTEKPSVLIFIRFQKIYIRFIMFLDI